MPPSASNQHDKGTQMVNSSTHQCEPWMWTINLPNIYRQSQKCTLTVQYRGESFCRVASSASVVLPVSCGNEAPACRSVTCSASVQSSSDSVALHSWHKKEQSFQKYHNTRYVFWGNREIIYLRKQNMQVLQLMLNRTSFKYYGPKIMTYISVCSQEKSAL